MFKHIVALIALVFLTACASTQENKNFQQAGQNVTATESKSCVGFGCGGGSTVIVVPTAQGGSTNHYYRGHYQEDRVPSIEYGRMDPRSGITKANVGGVWRQCDGRNRDRWDSCGTREGERNANKWSASSPP